MSELESINWPTRDALRLLRKEKENNAPIIRIVLTEGERVEDLPDYNPDANYVIRTLLEPKRVPHTFRYPCALKECGAPVGAVDGDIYIDKDGKE